MNGHKHQGGFMRLIRRLGEEFNVGSATIRVASVQGDQVQLEVEAPPGTMIRRREITERFDRWRERRRGRVCVH